MEWVNDEEAPNRLETLAIRSIHDLVFGEGVVLCVVPPDSVSLTHDFVRSDGSDQPGHIAEVFSPSLFRSAFTIRDRCGIIPPPLGNRGLPGSVPTDHGDEFLW